MKMPKKKLGGGPAGEGMGLGVVVWGSGGRM